MTLELLPLIAYGRVSRDAGRSKAGTLHSDKSQLKEARQIARRQGREVWPEAFMDLNQSGSSFDRPGFSKVLELIRSGQAGGVVMTQLDRLSRAELHQAVAMMGEVEELGGQFLTHLGYRSVMGDEALLTVAELWAAARFYRDRVKSGADSRQRAVVEEHAHLYITFGYRRAGVDCPEYPKSLWPLPAEAATVELVFQLRGEQGWSWSRIATHLNGQGITTRSGKQWNHSQIRQLITKRVYLGEAHSGDFQVKGAHPALVSPELWNLANSTLTTREQPAGSDSLLSGLCRCSGCGYVMVHSQVRRNGKLHRYYRCSQRQNGTQGRCEVAVNIPAAEVELAAVEAFAQAVWAEAPATYRVAGTGEQLEQLRGLVDAATQERDAVALMIARRDPTGTGSLDHLGDQADQALAEAQQQLQQAELSARRLDVPADLTRSLWSQASPERRNHLLGRVIAFVRCSPAPAGSWRAPAAERVQILRRDQVNGDDWITAARVAA